jgi:tRNA pseudouridine32 synthase/23S rRNA pseudouridine746 synthase
MLQTGAVTVRFRGKGPWTRVRDGRIMLDPLDEIQAVYEPRVLSMPEFSVTTAVWENNQYGVWWKPAGIMSQGTEAGDHTSIMRAVEKLGRKPYLVHRLDRETEGLIILAYTPKAAALLSDLFVKQAVHKTYWAIVSHARYLDNEEEGKIDYKLDGKEALTHWILKETQAGDRAWLELRPATGRLHQIRRHLEMKGTPVWGDPKYGKGNKNRDGMKLASVGLSFPDPFEKVSRDFHHQASFLP